MKYKFPKSGFTFYAEPIVGRGERIDFEPFAKKQYFVVTGFDGIFLKGNLEVNPLKSDFYVKEKELVGNSFKYKVMCLYKRIFNEK